MLRIAGQTAGPIELTFFVDALGWPGVLKLIFFSEIFLFLFFHGQRRTLQLVIIYFTNIFLQSSCSTAG